MDWNIYKNVLINTLSFCDLVSHGYKRCHCIPSLAFNLTCKILICQCFHATLPPYLHAGIQSDMQPCHHICKLVFNQICSNLATIFTCWIPIRHAATLSQNLHAGIQPDMQQHCHNFAMQQPCHHIYMLNSNQTCSSFVTEFACWYPTRHTATLPPYMQAGMQPGMQQPCHHICMLNSNQTCSSFVTEFACWYPTRHAATLHHNASRYATRHAATLPPYLHAEFQSDMQ